MDRGRGPQSAGEPGWPSATSMRTSGSSTTPTPTGRRPTTSPRNSRRSCRAPAAVPDRSRRHNVLPLDDRAAQRADPDRAGRPVVAREPPQRLYRGIGRLNAFSVISIKNKSHRVTAEVVVPRAAARRDRRPGGFPGGWSIYVKEAARLLLQLLRRRSVPRRGYRAFAAGNAPRAHEFRV